MKTIIKLPIILFALLLSLTSMAQDVIIDTEGETIDCTVLTVNQTAVVYRKDNKAVSLPKSKVMIIYYGNGTQEVFNKEEQPAKKETVVAVIPETKTLASVAPATKSVIPATDTITRKRSTYYLGDKKLAKKELYKLINDSNCEDAKVMLKKRKGGNFVTVMGLVAEAAGAASVVIALSDGADDTALLGGSAVLGGLTFVLIGNSIKNSKVRKAVVLYNQCISK